MTERFNPTCKNYILVEDVKRSNGEPFCGFSAQNEDQYSQELQTVGFSVMISYVDNNLFRNVFEKVCEVSNSFIAENKWTVFAAGGFMHMAFANEADAIRYKIMYDTTP